MRTPVEARATPFLHRPRGAASPPALPTSGDVALPLPGMGQERRG